MSDRMMLFTEKTVEETSATVVRLMRQNLKAMDEAYQDALDDSDSKDKLAVSFKVTFEPCNKGKAIGITTKMSFVASKVTGEAQGLSE